MQPSAPTHDMLTDHYTTAVDALCAVAGAYYALGRLGDARHLLLTSLALLEAREATPQQRQKVLLLYGQVLVVEHFLTRGEHAEAVFSPILQAQQIAEAAGDRQGLADALSLLGRAHYFVSVAAHLRAGAPLASSPGDGKFDRALAYQQRALELRQALRDTRGLSESHFQIGAVFERWQQHERARDSYAQARQIADRHGHGFEKTEPARHLAFQALREGNLDLALTLALEALALREEARFRPYLPLDHLLLREIYLAKGDTANAQLHTRQAQTLAEEMGLQSLVSAVPSIRDALAAQRGAGASA